MKFILWLIIGALAGWLAGKLTRGKGYGLIRDIIVGIIGAYIGGWLWGVLKLPALGGAFIGPLVTATVGAVVLLVLLRLVRA
jgi:uncharacterized membrane protein YeaQ/YmgE (transglycosylase-associated protein family)